MIKTTKTPLQEKFDSLPRGIELQKHVLPLLEKTGISQATFYRDRLANGNSIPYERLHIYAGLLDCEVAELIDSFTKVKPLVKKSSLTTKLKVKQ